MTLISGKVNHVGYQPGERDAFYPRYSYDAENRITNAETSRDSLIMKTSNKILLGLLIIVFAVPFLLALTLKSKIKKAIIPFKSTSTATTLL